MVPKPAAVDRFSRLLGDFLFKLLNKFFVSRVEWIRGERGIRHVVYLWNIDNDGDIAPQESFPILSRQPSVKNEGPRQQDPSVYRGRRLIRLQRGEPGSERSAPP